MMLPIIEDDFDFVTQDEVDRIEGSVRSRLNGRVRGFRVLIQEDGLVLQGFALNFYAKQLAQHAIMQATRLPIMANEIVVEF